jgi:tRNA pseudouridine38-40 synthase
MRIALLLEYDGREFCGWQSQPSGCAVQDALERSLAPICGSFVRVVAAGRTDSGVHATAQVVHFDTPVERPMTAWVRGVNGTLPDGMAVLHAQPVADAFHARFSATGRAYTYVLLNRPARPGLESGRVGWFHRPLELERMRAAARLLLGVHDFSAFRASECQAESPLRELRRLDVERRGELIVFRAAANAFLQHMVRNIVGSLVYVGKGKHPPAWLGDVLAGRERSAAAPTFAPDGLYLTSVEYDSEWGLTRLAREPLVLT